ncbi:hypothetical protein GDO81_030144 [Engystomops pustulosus]|uniref:Uncharacterized protein n=1 Tax=Engystomops pustulosus TaxID=76066 RepID=A0AAV6YLG2_ENGPU|nr:hypothetical protein GDO81_030144 [Engystomops pustulosus]
MRLPSDPVPRPWLPPWTSRVCRTTRWYHAAARPSCFAMGSVEDQVPLRFWSQVSAYIIVHGGPGGSLLQILTPTTCLPDRYP